MKDVFIIGAGAHFARTEALIEATKLIDPYLAIKVITPEEVSEKLREFQPEPIDWYVPEISYKVAREVEPAVFYGLSQFIGPEPFQLTPHELEEPPTIFKAPETRRERRARERKNKTH